MLALVWCVAAWLQAAQAPAALPYLRLLLDVDKAIL